MRTRVFLIVLLLIVFAASSVSKWMAANEAKDSKPIAFRPPTKRERQRAIGSMRGVTWKAQRAFLQEGFDPIPKPEALDWLANHREPGQTFAQFTAVKPNRPDKTRNRIYFQPIGSFESDVSPRFEDLQRFAEAYFSLEVRTLPALSYDKLSITDRKSEFNGRRQYLTPDILSFLKGRLPADAYCLLAITMEDLYPDEAWNFVFGQASLKNRVGVYSFARYDPRRSDEKATDEHRRIVLRRSCKVLAHETAHMFGMRHCIYFSCIINGSNHMRESDSREIHMCPVCLRKLQWSLKADVIARYEKLEAVYKEMGLDKEANWIRKRIAFVRSDQD